MAKKKSLIGYDPLAWMKNTPAAAPPAADIAPLPEAAPAPAAAPSRGEPDVHLSEALTIAHIRGIHEELKRVLQTAPAGATVWLDGSAVVTVDTAGAQLLVAFVRAAQAQGVAVRWREAVAPALSECARRLGLHEALELP